MTITEILTKIANKDLELSTIEQSKLKPFEKIILTSAYFERNGKRKYACYILNELIKENPKNSELLLIIKLLLERLKVNHKFSINPYLSIIDYATNLCKGNYDPEIQSLIQSLKQLETEEAYLQMLTITSCKRYDDNEVIAEIRLNILIKENRLDEALRICLNPIFQNSLSIQERLSEILLQKGYSPTETIEETFSR